jgi:hypothetical protein
MMPIKMWVKAIVGTVNIMISQALPFSANARGLRSTARARASRFPEIELTWAASFLNRDSNSEVSRRIHEEFDNGEYYYMFPLTTNNFNPAPNPSPGTMKTFFGDGVAEMLWEQYFET